jgi:hypothetical protein
MISNKVEERLIPCELPGTQHGMCVSLRILLLHKCYACGFINQQLPVGIFIPRPNHDTDVIDPCPHCFSNYETQHRSFHTVVVEERLHGQCALVLASRCDYGLRDSHIPTMLMVPF